MSFLKRIFGRPESFDKSSSSQQSVTVQTETPSPKQLSLTIERIINVVVVVAGLPETDNDIKWLRQQAGQDLFVNVNPILAKAIFADKRITFQSGCSLIDPKNISPTDLISAATRMIDSGDIGIIIQHGDAISVMPSSKQINLSVAIAISFQAAERPIIHLPLSTPLSPGYLINIEESQISNPPTPPETKYHLPASGNAFLVPLENAQHILMIVVASPADETEYKWLSIEFLLRAFGETNPSCKSLVRQLSEQDKLTLAVYQRPQGQSLDPSIATKNAIDQLGQLATTCSLVFQSGMVKTKFPNGTMKDVGLLFVVAYIPPAGEKPIVQMAALNRPMLPMSMDR